MKVVKIEFPIASKLDELENENLDVLVELEDGITYVVVVSTPEGYRWCMENENVNYFCGVPMIVVKKLTEEIIEEAINEYAEGDAYWLKYYHLSGLLGIENINMHLKELKDFSDEFDRAFELKSEGMV